MYSGTPLDIKKSFDYKTSTTGTSEGDNTEKEAEIVVPLKCLSNFWEH